MNGRDMKYINALCTVEMTRPSMPAPAITVNAHTNAIMHIIYLVILFNFELFQVCRISHCTRNSPCLQCLRIHSGPGWVFHTCSLDFIHLRPLWVCPGLIKMPRRLLSFKFHLSTLCCLNTCSQVVVICLFHRVSREFPASHRFHTFPVSRIWLRIQLRLDPYLLTMLGIVLRVQDRLEEAMMVVALHLWIPERRPGRTVSML